MVWPAPRAPLANAGFGDEVRHAMERRKDVLVQRGHAWRTSDGGVRAPRDLVARLEWQEIACVGPQMAAARGMTFVPAQAGDQVSGTLLGIANLASGRFAMIETFSGMAALAFSSFPGSRSSTGRSGATSPASCALILARAFGNSPDFWLNVERRTDLRRVMNSPRERAVSPAV